MKVEQLIRIINSDFYVGVPDSQLRALCDYLMSVHGIDKKHHIIAANEGNCVGLAAGYHLATGKIPVVYMQNSGEGNVINPVASLLNEKVYGIPVIFIIGWRGEPGVHDEPQHIYQGEITIKLLDDMEISSYVIGKDTTDDEVSSVMNGFRQSLSEGKSVAFVVKKDALSYEEKIKYENFNVVTREEVIRHIVDVAEEDLIVSTTGKASRELFEIREKLGMEHKYDFLTVGSMGHTSSIVLGIAIHKPEKKVWCIDGDGAALMHMGSMAVIGYHSPANMVHIVINNGAHETVGGMPTVANTVDFVKVAEACGYSKVFCANNLDELDMALYVAKKENKLCFIEVKCGLGSRKDLGRPTTTANENKVNFMKFLSKN